MPNFRILGDFMKYLIAALLLTSTFANTCQINLEDHSLGDTYFDEDSSETSFYTEVTSGSTTLSKEEFETNITFKDFDYESCFDALVYKEFINPLTNESFTAIYSNEDHCDGGNSYGYITKTGNKEILATIQDSDFYCL